MEEKSVHIPYERSFSLVAPKSPKGGLKTQNGRSSLKLHFCWRKSATKFLCVKTVGISVVEHSLA